ncbi:MAG: 8-oxoguanine deaminase [Solirubrobacteraceae bacterium]|nr:8-oxoguanine deaminase [Solirubrobacteraceae bacterium]
MDLNNRQSADLLVRDADLVVTMAGEEIPGGWVAIANGCVQAIGPAGDEPETADWLSARGALVTPGLINTHHHMFQNLTRAYGPAVGCGLFDWLRTLYPLWARLDEEAVYVSTYVGLVELALGGTTTTTDHLYIHPTGGLIDAQIRAAREVGLRFHPTRGSMSLTQKDGGLPPDELGEDEDEVLADCERLVGAYHDRSPGAMTQIALAPCSPFSVTGRLMERTALLAERLDVRLHTHLAEDRDEDDFCAERFGCRPIEYFERLGWGSSRAWIAHCVWPSKVEIERLGAWGTGVAHCPTSNMLLIGATAAARALREAGSPVGLGCDGAGGDHASLWLEARMAMLLGRHGHGPTGMSARDALHMATVGSAGCLGRDGELGALRVGAPADLVVWDIDEVALAGAHTDAVAAWLRSGPARARHTVVGGNAVVRDGRFRDDGLTDALRDHRRISTEWQRAALGAGIAVRPGTDDRPGRA